MTRPAVLLLAVGVLAVVGAAVSLGIRAADWASSPFGLDSNSNRFVATVDGQLVSYERFETGIEPALIGAGLVLVVASVFLAAVIWRQRPASRSSTAGSNAAAQTR